MIPVGPDEREPARTADLLASLGAYAAVPFAFVLVDDAAAPRDLLRGLSVPAHCCALVELRHLRRSTAERARTRYRRSKGVCAAVLQGFAWVARNASQVRFAMKLDTDSLVIGPFFERLARLFDQHPEVGIAGAFDRTPNRTRRDFRPHAPTIRRLHRQARLARWLPWLAGDAGTRALGERVRSAVANGYRFGEHCLGGGYAVSGELLRRMLAGGHFEDSALWLPLDCPEDVMMGMYTRAAGLRSMNFVAAGEVFGVRYRGLPGPPPELLARGYAVIHSVKNDHRASEAEIRAFFRRTRSEGSRG